MEPAVKFKQNADAILLYCPKCNDYYACVLASLAFPGIFKCEHCCKSFSTDDVAAVIDAAAKWEKAMESVASIGRAWSRNRKGD